MTSKKRIMSLFKFPRLRRSSSKDTLTDGRRTNSETAEIPSPISNHSSTHTLSSSTFSSTHTFSTQPISIHTLPSNDSLPSTNTIEPNDHKFKTPDQSHDVTPNVLKIETPDQSHDVKPNGLKIETSDKLRAFKSNDSKVETQCKTASQLHDVKSDDLECETQCKTAGQLHDVKLDDLEFGMPDQLEMPKPSLWDRAYDSIMEKDKELVQVYEKLLSMELHTIMGNPINPHGDTYTNLAVAKNQIDHGNRQARLEQMETITRSGLQQLENGRTKFFMFGHKFVLRKQLTQATRFIQDIRNVIDDAVKVSPYASLAWAGVCVILPIFMNPSIAEETSREGCLYVTSRIQFYVKLESLLFASQRLQDSGLNAELESRLIELYRQIIEFQLKVVRRVYLTRLVRFREDAVQHEDWKDMVAKIQESEKIFSNDAKQANDAAMGRELEKLSGNAEKFFTDITSALVPLLRDKHKTSASIFRNTGSGSQFNATTGGVQNNAIGNGTHFIGTTFSGTVSFG